MWIKPKKIFILLPPVQPIKFSNDDDKYYQSPIGGYGNNNGYNDDPRNNLNPYNDGFHEQFRVENENLQKYLNEVDQKSSLECQLNVAAQWLFENNVNEATQLDAVSWGRIEASGDL